MKAVRCGKQAWQPDAFILTMDGYTADQIATALDRAARYHRNQSRAAKKPYATRQHHATAERLDDYAATIRNAT